VEAQTALVRTDRTVELHAVTHIDLSLTLVVDPRNAEHDDPLGHGHALKQSLAAILLLVGVYHGAQGVQHLLNGLVELGLTGVLGNDLVNDLINVRHGKSPFYT